MRIGHGYDVHRTDTGSGITLGGVKIACELSLVAHSDGDVLVHAVIDALFGAAGLPDIGVHFPDTDPVYRNVCSLTLLQKAAEYVRELGLEITCIDSTILAQVPKMAPYIAEMRATMASALGMSADRVNVKATTEEYLGFTGSGKGIAAHAICLLEEKR